MKLKLVVACLCTSMGLVAGSHALAQTVQTETKYVTVDGEVIRYEPGKVIVVRGADSKEVTYTLAPTLVMPADIQVGRRVTLYTEPATNGGTQIVSRVTTTTVTPEGQVKRTTEDTRVLPSGATTKTTTTSISGKVASYEAGKTLTITKADGSKITYLIDKTSRVPADLGVGKTVTILPLPSNNPGDPIAKTITVTTAETAPPQ
jgi:uncharacterized protein YndB with AHSA1/START domain